VGIGREKAGGGGRDLAIIVSGRFCNRKEVQLYGK